jgi:hypothetical protein
MCIKEQPEIIVAIGALLFANDVGIKDIILDGD